MILNDGSEWEAEAEQIAGWKAAYPAVNVEGEMKKMAAWLLSNPKNRKTKNGIARFVNTWLARAQDRGGASPVSSSLRGNSLDRDLADVSWVPRDQRESAARYFIAKYGCFWDGEQFREAV